MRGEETKAHLQQLSSSSSTLHVDTQANAEEALEFRTQLVGLLERGSSVGGDEVESLERFLIEVGRFVLDHL